MSQPEEAPIQNSFSQGFWGGMPIGLGYFSVAFAFGISAVAAGVPVWGAALISMTNVTSAGQFAGLSLMATGAGLAEQALTQLVINLRYALMSLSLSQRLDPAIGLLDRLFMAFLNTDEVFAVASSQPGLLGRRYFHGLMLAPPGRWRGRRQGRCCPRRSAPPWALPSTGCSWPLSCPRPRRTRRCAGCCCCRWPSAA